MDSIEHGLRGWKAAQRLPQGVYPTAQVARTMLAQQPFSAACRARHEIVPVHDTNLLGERIGDRPIGYCYRLKATASR